jgi:RNA polymerase sigma-70 factor (ECF subfamily)
VSAVSFSFDQNGVRRITATITATRANGQPALAAYALDESSSRFVQIALDVLFLRGDEIAAVTAFRTPGLFRAFGLPETLPR